MCSILSRSSDRPSSLARSLEHSVIFYLIPSKLPTSHFFSFSLSLIGGQIVGGVAGSLSCYGVNKFIRKGMKKYNERQEQEARNLEGRKRLISSGGNEIRGPEELRGGTLNRLVNKE